MGQQMLQQGVLPTDFFATSFSDLMDVQKAKSRKDRIQDPVALAMSAGGFSSL
ncbi:MAG TPA: hypothetical protein H9792_04330 [Candidatus Limosilactobacillus excrementigallinarum]|nr:hypothetical protein [Candidatus Limosilactobacillus excrementigallinarum]